MRKTNLKKKKPTKRNAKTTKKPIAKPSKEQDDYDDNEYNEDSKKDEKAIANVDVDENVMGEEDEEEKQARKIPLKKGNLKNRKKPMKRNVKTTCFSFIIY